MATQSGLPAQASSAAPVPRERIRACVFDAYGTLFDVASAAEAGRATLGDAATALAALWRRKQLEYTWLRSLMGVYSDFWQVTGDALDYALQALGRTDPALRTRLMEAYLTLAPYPEVPGVLRRLGRAGIARAILSNGSPAMLSAAVSAAGIGSELAAVLSVDIIRVYKPDPRVYRLAANSLGIAPGEICFLSANAWDVAGAAHFGFQAVRVDRTGEPAERLPGRPTATIPDLDGLPALLGIA